MRNGNIMSFTENVIDIKFCKKLFLSINKYTYLDKSDEIFIPLEV